MRLTVLIMAAALAAASCGQSSTPAGERSADWRQVDGAPLSPRQNAVGVWTGEEVLLIGGSKATPCPPVADCMRPGDPPLVDGAAYRPATGQWRKLPDAPVGLEFGTDTVLIGDTLYLWTAEVRDRSKPSGALLAYHMKQNRWQRLSLPSGHTWDWYDATRVGDRVVLYSGSDENDEQPDLVYDPTRRAWSELPADPLSPSGSRSMVWTGDRLVLLDHALTPNQDGDRPQFLRAAVLDPAAGTWRRLPDSESLGIGHWFPVDDGRLINPHLGGENGGDVNGWGRSYPFGGILDPETGKWSKLPDPPSESDPSGLLTPSGGYFLSERGLLLDTATDRWIRIPKLDEPDDYVQSRTVVAAGRDLFVYGGARFPDEESEGELLNDTLIWSPPS